MRLLILGNGFDMAHGLPTSYFDFLFYCCRIKKRKFKGKIIDNGKLKPFEIKSPNEDIIEALKPYKKTISKNVWINHFLFRIQDLKPTWIDLEQEIKTAVAEKKAIFTENGMQKEIDGPSDLCSISMQNVKFALEELKEILNIYLLAVSKTNNGIFYNDVLNFKPSNVLTFNYTQTFERIYGDNLKIEHVHGEINENSKENSIVLGFDTFGKRELDCNNAEFLKTYQILNNEIAIDVCKKIENLSTDNERKVMVIGSSLDLTDSDIIKPILENAEEFIVCYHNDSSKSDLIKNLMRWYERDGFNEIAKGKNQKIYFKKLCEKQNDKTAAAYIPILLQKTYLIEDTEDFSRYLDYCINDPFPKENDKYCLILESIADYYRNYQTICQKHLDESIKSKIRELLRKKMKISEIRRKCNWKVWDIFNLEELEIFSNDNPY